MAVMDEFREERATLKNADFKTKIQYFLDYYKWPTVIGIGVIVLLVAVVYSMATSKDTALSGYFVNAQSAMVTDNTINTTLSTDFSELAGIDLNKYTVNTDTTLQYVLNSRDEVNTLTLQRLSVTVAAQETDFIAADDTVFQEFYHLAGFYDLRNIYSEETLEKYADYLYYVDMAVIREQEAALEMGSAEYANPTYDHYAPELMEDPAPIAFCVEDSPQLEGLYTDYDGRVLLGITQAGQRLDTTLQFVDYVLEGMVE